jgi:hypothetical protein
MREEQSLPAAPDKTGVPVLAAAAVRRKLIVACEQCGADATRYINAEGIKVHLCAGCAAKHRTRPPDPE